MPLLKTKRRQARKLEECLRQHAREAWAIAYTLIRDAHEAEDAVQQACVVAARKIDKLPTDNPWPWLRTVIIGEARNARRRLQKARRPVSLTGEEYTMEQIDHQSVDPEREILRKEDADALWAALDELDEHEREALLLTNFNGMTHKQAAEALGLSEKTVSSQVKRGMEKLSAKLSKGEHRIAYGIAALPLVEPSGGLASALSGWLSAVQSVLTTGAIGAGTATTTGVTLMANKTVVAATAAAILTLGGISGALINEGLQDKESEPAPKTLRQNEASVAADRDDLRVELDAMKQKLAGLQKDLKASQAEAGEHKMELATANTKLSETNRDLADVLKERDELREKYAGLVERERTGDDLPLAFGDLNDINNLREAKWSEMASAALRMNEIFLAIKRAQVDGEEFDRSTVGEIAVENQKLASYAIAVAADLETHVQGNGGFVHPVTLINILAEALSDAGKPLSDAQRRRIAQIGEDYMQAYEQAQVTYDEDTLSVKKISDEVGLKVKAAKAVRAELRQDQFDAVYERETVGRAQLDVLSPLMMLQSSTMPVYDETIEGILDDTKEQFQSAFDLDDGQMALLSGAFSDYWDSLKPSLEKVPAAAVFYFSEDEAVRAFAETAKLQARIVKILRERGADTTKIENTVLVLVPRLQEPVHAHDLAPPQE